ncbi:cytochrome c [Aquimarina sp. ERC-38]|uniref:c-type cytochrome n=1 Tax=Aquimarina sp. ERC-38 TaxID=2949996 RepID=UPI0022475502|nr:cytochrome c [Aquimarina sp. ERC-38]UZO81221.1 cytochrome c [Aquimarina sp. ERC-38]
MKNITYNIAFLLILVFAVSCKDSNDRNIQYMPNMYRPVGYEAYGEYEVFENEQEAKLPVEGSVPRDWLPYDYPDSAEGYQAAKASLKNPIKYTEDNLAEGGQLYNIYCAICHGAKGNGKGYLVETEKILGVPSYDDQGRAITEGSIYHVMYHGINSMGSYASQTNEKERWQIVAYVEKLKADLEGKTPREDDKIKNTIDSVSVDQEGLKKMSPPINSKNVDDLEEAANESKTTSK